RKATTVGALSSKATVATETLRPMQFAPRWARRPMFKKPPAASIISPIRLLELVRLPTLSAFYVEKGPANCQFICRRDGDRVRVFSRNGRDWTDRVPLIAEALAKLRVKSASCETNRAIF